MAILLSGAMIALAVFLKPIEGIPAASRRDLVASGKEYGKVLVSSYADSLDLAGNEIAAGKAIGEAQGLMQESWSKQRVAEFNRIVAPGLNHVLPEGNEPTSSEQRSAVSGAFHDLAKGVRSACATGSNWLGR
jgi:hypothetical protein